MHNNKTSIIIMINIKKSVVIIKKNNWVKEQEIFQVLMNINVT